MATEVTGHPLDELLGRKEGSFRRQQHYVPYIYLHLTHALKEQDYGTHL